VSASLTRKNPEALKELAKRLQEQCRKEIAVGFPAGATQSYPDGTRVIDVAACHVFGVGVPQRDFMAAAKSGIATAVKPVLAALANAETAEEAKALQNAAGQVAQEEIREAIIALQDPPNSAETIARKGSSNPLIDTGHMKDSVTYVVRDKRPR